MKIMLIVIVDRRNVDKQKYIYAHLF